MNLCYKFFLPFTLLLISFSSYSQKSFKLKDSSRLELSENGKATFFYSDGRKMSEGKMVKGKREGEWKFYKGYEKPHAIEQYEKGLLEGGAIYYYIGTGVKKSEGQYNNGKINGEWKFYSLYKELLYSVVNFRDGILSGPAKYYDTNTRHKIGEGIHGNGKRQGEWKFYAYRTGKLHGIENYKDGLMEGIASYYDTVTSCETPVCSKLADGQYERNLRIGVWTFYDSPTGKIISKETYKDSLLNGLGIYYDMNTGNIVSKNNYKDGILHGTCSHYDSVSGYKNMEATFENGEDTGAYKLFFNDSREIVKSIFRHKGFILQGANEQYDSLTGNITHIYDYENDSIIGYSNLDEKGRCTSYYSYAKNSDSSYLIIYNPDCEHKESYGFYRDTSYNEGVVNYYYKCSDKVQSKIILINGLYEGAAKYYDSMYGTLITEGQFANDMRTGKWTYYYLNSTKVFYTMIYNNDTVDGMSYYYDSSTGKLLAEGKFKKGERDGNWIIYNIRSGKPVLEESYKDGEQDGKQIWYDTSGNTNAYYNYKNGVKSGDALINHYGNTQPWIRFKFNNDSLHGRLNSFYPDGKLKREEEYTHGKLVTTKCYTQNGDTTEYYPIIIREEFEEDVMNYIGSNLQYPKEAKDSKAEGKVTVRFKIHESGKVSDAEVIKSAGHGMDEEALRIISQMPPWQPAYFDGVPYATYKTLPVVFWLQKTE